MSKMKKLICVMLALVMAMALCPATAFAAASDYSVGDKIQLGTYEQDDNNSNGKEPITWIILDKKGGKVLLLSEKCLDVRPYDTSEASVTWETSELRAWLNDEFLNSAFDSSEQSCIVETKNKNPKSASGVSGGSDTDDMVFLLSARECETYMKSNSDRQAEPTDYAEGLGVDNEHKGPYCRWWLRTPGGSAAKAANVHAAGGINFNGKDNDVENLAVRPALWFDVTNYSAEMDTGTKAVDTGTASVDADSSTKQGGGKMRLNLELGDSILIGASCGVSNCTMMDHAYYHGYTWTVIHIENNQALLLCDDIVALKSYDSKEETTWEDCALREWLNGEFYDNCLADDPGAAAIIDSMKITQYQEVPEGSKSGDEKIVTRESQEKVFLISIDELLSTWLFVDEVDANKLMTATLHRSLREDNSALYYDGETVAWWLRDPIMNKTNGTYISEDGLMCMGDGNVTDVLGVRPAIWVNI